jgi:RNA polymerase sigma factor (sigma-70 family)
MSHPPSTGPLDALSRREPEFVDFVTRRVGDRALAEDVVHTVFARAVERIAELADERAAGAWFYRSLRNAIVDEYRRRGVESRALESVARELDERATAYDGPAPRVCRCVLRVAESLKVEYLEALRSIEIDGDAVKDFASQRGISSSNAAVRVFRAREALRRGVVASCGACAADGCADCTCTTGDAAGGHGCLPH